MGYSGARGKLIHEKNLKSKILCQTPFKRHTHFPVTACETLNSTNVVKYLYFSNVY